MPDGGYGDVLLSSRRGQPAALLADLRAFVQEPPPALARVRLRRRQDARDALVLRHQRVVRNVHAATQRGIELRLPIGDDVARDQSKIALVS